MKSVLCGVLMAALVTGAFGDEARWIWYPGDYGIWWGNNLQSERLQWGARLPPFWPLYEPHNRVILRKDALEIPEDDLLEVRCDGNAIVCYTAADGGYRESAAICGRFTLPKGAKAIEIKIQNSARPPSVWVKGRYVRTDATWTASWTATGDALRELPVDSSARFTDPATPPGLAKLPVVPVEPKWAKAWKGSHLIADFGEETYGYLKLRDVKGRGAVKIIYAESESEMYAEELTTTEFGALDGWEQIELSATPEYRRAIAHGFRYVHVIPVSGDVTVGGVALDRESKGLAVRGSFRSSDPELDRIWEVAVRTLELTCREVFIEGVKRDHWVWSGDAVQSFLMNYYTFADYDGCRDTLWALRGKDPVVMHLNNIMDYTFYWFDAVERYRLYSGDTAFVRQVWPRLKTLMDFALGRTDKDGRPADLPGDWVFIDWAPEQLHNDGVTAFEQMLLVRALEAAAGVADDVGEKAVAADYRARSAKLRAEVKPLFWNEEMGALLHHVRKDGAPDPQLTRYPNMFGLFWGYFTPEESERVAKNVILNDKVMKIQTPYMRFYELEALCALGLQKEVLGEIKSYWGGMLKLGATSFWELYNPSESGEAHYAMYGRRFGRSLCHAWGASPAYLLGKYYLGVVPTKPGFAAYEVKPAPGGLEWMEGDVPAPFGLIHVRTDAKGVSVRSDGGEGTLVMPDGRRLAIPAGEVVSAGWTR